jgi:hypothetical protein
MKSVFPLKDLANQRISVRHDITKSRKYCAPPLLVVALFRREEPPFWWYSGVVFSGQDGVREQTLLTWSRACDGGSFIDKDVVLGCKERSHWVRFNKICLGLVLGEAICVVSCRVSFEELAQAI